MPSEHESLREKILITIEGIMSYDWEKIDDRQREISYRDNIADYLIDLIQQHDEYVIGENEPPVDTDWDISRNVLRAEQRNRAKASYGTEEEK